MEFQEVPIGFGMALSQNEAALIRYGALPDSKKKKILEHAQNVRSEQEMYTLVANLAIGDM